MILIKTKYTMGSSRNQIARLQGGAGPAAPRGPGRSQRSLGGDAKGCSHHEGRSARRRTWERGMGQAHTVRAGMPADAGAVCGPGGEGRPHSGGHGLQGSGRWAIINMIKQKLTNGQEQAEMRETPQNQDLTSNLQYKFISTTN